MTRSLLHRLNEQASFDRTMRLASKRQNYAIEMETVQKRLEALSGTASTLDEVQEIAGLERQLTGLGQKIMQLDIRCGFSSFERRSR